MNNDTEEAVGIAQLESGMRTLVHDWRNVLNGINLRISSAKYAEETADREEDLAEAQQLVVSATAQLTSLSRRLTAPSVTPIPYPTAHFFEDVAAHIGGKMGKNASRLKWETEGLAEGAVLVDFIAMSQALGELLDNTLRYLSSGGTVTINSRLEDACLVLSWNEPKAGPPTSEWGQMPFFTTERGRLGLGLYFARRILQAHGGSLSFDYSDAEQEMETTLRIPRADP